MSKTRAICPRCGALVVTSRVRPHSKFRCDARRERRHLRQERHEAHVTRQRARKAERLRAEQPR